MNLTWTASGVAVTSVEAFTEVTGTFVFNDDDIRAFYVDWSDGTDPSGNISNKKKYADYQWVESTEPVATDTAEHIYTATGTAYDPIVQTMNSRGFFSKYYGSGASNTDIKPYAQVASSATWTQLAVTDGTATGIMKTENRTVKSGIDNSIFNAEGPKDLFIAVVPTLSVAELAYLCETGSATTGSVEIDVKCVLDYGVRDGSTQSETTTAGGERIVKTLSVVLSGAHLTGSVTTLRNVLASGGAATGALESGAQVAQILEVKYKNPKYMGTDTQDYTKNEVYNRFKAFFLVSSSLWAKYIPVTYISAGDPIKKATDPLRNVTLDFSQSRAKASNISLDSYRYDIGKSWFQSANKWSTEITDATCDITNTDATVTMDDTSFLVVGASVSGADVGSSRTISSITDSTTFEMSANAGATTSDITMTFGQSNVFGNATKQTGVTKKTAYTYMVRPDGLGGNASYNLFTTSLPWDTGGSSDTLEDQLALDDYGRFYPQYHLTRVSAEPASSARKVSSLIDNQPSVFRITPAISWNVTSDGSTVTSLANSRVYPTKLLDNLTNASKSKDYTNHAFNNISGSSGRVSMAGMNAMTFYDVTNTERANASEYLLLMFDKKTNKIFLNMSSYADNIQSALGTESAYGIAGVYYLALEDKGTPIQNAYWSPLEFEDTTAVIKEYRDTVSSKYTSMKAPLSKSGYISFDMPLDWGALSITGACGGIYNSTDIPTATGAYDYGLMTVAFDGWWASESGDGVGIGDFATYQITTETDVPYLSGQTASSIGSFKYVFIPTLPVEETGTAYWVSADGTSGYAQGTLALNLGVSGSYNDGTDEYNVLDITQGLIRRVNIYDIIDGFSKVYKVSGATDNKHLYNVDAHEGLDTADYWNNTYMVNTGTTVGAALASEWADEKYLLKIVLSGAVAPTTLLTPEIWNIFDATRGYGDIIKEVDNSAYNLNSLSITSDIGITRAGNYYQAITRKGKVFIARVGTPIQTIGFTSVALGDTSSATPFTTWGPRGTLYGHLHMLRKVHADNVRVYWDEIQKDGTYVRFWGVVIEVSESHGMGGPRAVVGYNFNMVVEEIALIDSNFKLMTDVFPLGSVEDDRSYT